MLVSLVLSAMLAVVGIPCPVPCDVGDGRTMIVEVVDSWSDGDESGYDKDGAYIAYNIPVPKGEHVRSIVVYNPCTDYCDDVIAVYDNGMWR